MQSAVRDSLTLHPPQRREKRYAQEVISVAMRDRLVDMLEHLW
jgi:hypothetical protein